MCCYWRQTLEWRSYFSNTFAVFFKPCVYDFGEYYSGSYSAVAVVSISSHQIHTMAVFIPERSFVRERTVGDGDIIVIVVGGEGSVLMVAQRVALRKKKCHFSSISLSFFNRSECEAHMLTCGTTVCTDLDLVAGTRIPDVEFVVLSKRRLLSIPQVHAQLILTAGCDFVKIWKAWNIQRNNSPCRNRSAGTMFEFGRHRLT